MQDAAFFLADDDHEPCPTLYGAKLVDDGERTIVLEEQDCYPDGVERRLNQHAHYQGPRCYESGDTGAIMTAGLRALLICCFLTACLTLASDY